MPAKSGMEPLVEYLLGIIGPGKRYKSGRQLAIRAKLNQNTVNNILDRGRADPDTLGKLSDEIGVPREYLFKLAGWLEETERRPLTDEEQELLGAYRQSPSLARRLILAQARESASM